MLPSWASDTITVERAPLVDVGHNDLQPDWENAVPHDVEGCSVEPGASQEVLAGRDATLVRWTVHAPAGADVLSTDRVIWAGDPYGVDGEPLRYGVGIADHVVVALKDWKG